MTIFKKKFDKNLDASYKLVGYKIYKYDNLSINSIKNSISLFTKKSLALRKPEPINVNVYGLVSGLPFSKNTVKSIYNITSSIRDILKNSSFNDLLKAKDRLDTLVEEFKLEKQSNREISNRMFSDLYSLKENMKYIPKDENIY